MPQLNAADWVPQLFWLAITFLVLLLLMWKLALPRVGAVIEARRERIEGDLARAEDLKREAEEALAAYQAALDEARSKAKAMIAESRKTLDAEAAERKARLNAELAERTAAAAARIRAARDRAMANLREVARDVAVAAAGKLLGAAPDAETVARAVDDELG